MITWEKCASVTTGGKPYFYHGFTKNYQHMWIMWDRIKKCWKVEGECPQTGKIIVFKDGFASTKEATIWANENI